MIDNINESTTLIIGVCTAVALLAGGYKVLWYGKGNPRRPGLLLAFLIDLRGFRDAILGRDEVLDSITREVIKPPLPGIGTRMAHQETQMELLTVTVTKLVDQQVFLQGIAERVDSAESRLDKLEAAAVERVVAKAESTAAWRAMEAATNAKPDVEPELP
jgi:hypothetical protein